MIVALGCVYGLGMAFFLIAFLVEWIKSRRENKRYLKYGVLFGMVVVGVDLLTVAITPSAWDSSLLVALVAEPIVLIRLIGFTMLGMYYAALSGYPSFPLLLRKFKLAPPAEDTTSVVPTENPTTATDEKEVPPPDENPAISSVQAENLSQDQSPERPAQDLLIEVNWKDYCIKVLGASILGILYSSVLFLLTAPQMSEMAQQQFGVSSVALGTPVTIQVILVMFEVAIAEEIVFRLGIQNFLVKHLKLQNSNDWIAILITSALWTLGHAGVLEPEWVKLAQIFPVGLMLGWLYKRYGAESTMLVHGIFNFVLIFLSAYLIR